MIEQVVIISLAVPLVVLTLFLVRLRLNMRRMHARYAPIIEVDAELAKVQKLLYDAQRKHKEFLADSNQQRTQLIRDYDQAKITYEELKNEISLLEENLEDISFGVYRPHFTFQTSEEYKEQLETLRDRARQRTREGHAATCSAQWTVSGSAKDGARMAKQNMKLVLRAFNGECDAAITKVAWNNISKMEARINKSFDAINKLGTVLQVSITNDYLNLKLDELHVTHEYEEKRYEEREEQRRIRAELREEEKAQREIEKAREEAECEEARFEKALKKARDEAARATGEQLQKLTECIKSLEVQLADAHDEKERAVSRAQLTKSGYVYIISNTGSFGQDVYKVGMTRRWEPMERVKELGDASVPFPFDVHAMLFTENAPELESAPQESLNDRRINLFNSRKEFFHVSLDEVEKLVRERGLKAEFAKHAEAKEYRETLSLQQQQAKPTVQIADKFPLSPFDNVSKPSGAAGLDS